MWQTAMLLSRKERIFLRRRGVLLGQVVKNGERVLVLVATGSDEEPGVGELRGGVVVVDGLHRLELLLGQVGPIQLEVNLHGERETLEVLRAAHTAQRVVVVAVVGVERRRQQTHRIRRRRSSAAFLTAATFVVGRREIVGEQLARLQLARAALRRSTLRLAPSDSCLAPSIARYTNVLIRIFCLFC
jgi:hypothetical protein